jgi:hypothetical protein
MVSLLALVVLAAPAGKDAVDPREPEAKKACAAGQPQRGIDLLAEYYAESGDEMAIFNQGRCYQQNDMPRPALARFREFLRVARTVTHDVRHLAETHIQELEADLLREEQAQRAPPPPPSAPAAAPPVVLTAAPPPPRLPHHSWVRTTGWAMGGLAAVAAGTGLGFSLRLRRLDSELEHLGDHRRPVAYQDYESKMNGARQAQTLQWVGYGTALTAAVGSALCFAFSAGASGRSLALLPEAGPARVGGALRLRF